MTLFDTTGFRILEEGLYIVNKNKAIIGNNLANHNTPGYKCKYLNFNAVLTDKLGISENAKYKKELHLSSYVVTDTVTYDQADGNNVDTDTQESLFTKNGLLQEALINQMDSEFVLMRTAMRRT